MGYFRRFPPQYFRVNLFVYLIYFVFISRHRGEYGEGWREAESHHLVDPGPAYGAHIADSSQVTHYIKIKKIINLYKFIYVLCFSSSIFIYLFFVND